MGPGQAKAIETERVRFRAPRLNQTRTRPSCAEELAVEKRSKPGCIDSCASSEQPGTTIV
jgi:hypothetical protein